MSDHLETAESWVIIKELENLDEAEDGVRSQPASGDRRDNYTLSNMYVGLRYDVFRHICQSIAGGGWTRSQEG